MLLSQPDIQYQYLRHGFRSTFGQIAHFSRSKRKSYEMNRRANEPELPKSIDWWDVKEWRQDPFLSGIIMFGLVYLAAYTSFYTMSSACTVESPPRP
jgi:hypothetical protein